MKRNKIPRWLKWEFWPFWFFYFPVYFLILFRAIQSRTLSFFTLANPGMKMGGFANYSKYEILKQLDEKYLPKTILFEQQPAANDMLQKMNDEKISFPVILKPDEGERGWKVEKISNVDELTQYLLAAPIRFLLQEYMNYKEEYGIMYYRYPNEASGHVSSVVIRDFLSVTGDGKSTMIELFENCERCLYHLPMLKELYKNHLNDVLPSETKKVLVDIGNHSRGTTFLDGNYLISEKLISAFDQASSTLHEWYFGRFDVRAPSWNDLLSGNFKVVEVNGVNSEPAHIYDPNMSIFKAYGALFQHWNTIYKISRLNYKRGFKAEPLGSVWRRIREHMREKKQLS